MSSTLMSLMRPAAFSALWFCIFFGPLFYVLPMVGWNAWWSLLVGTAGAGVYVMMAGAVIWHERQQAS